MTETKPKPLDLKIGRIWNWISKDEVVKEFQDGKGLDVVIVKRVATLTTEYIKQRIKSACEFYLRYKDKPEEFFEDFDNFNFSIEKKEELADFICRVRNCSKEDLEWVLNDYNEWLFKLAFNFEEGENEKE